MRGFVRRSLQSSLSRGSGYEPQPPGRFFDTEKPRGYFIDFSAKTVAASAADPAAMVPAGLAQLGLGWWERRLAGDRSADVRFAEVCAVLRSRRIELNGETLWPYAVTVPKYRLVPPWYSALAQGQVASVFVRAYLHTQDERFAVDAQRAIRPLLPGSASGLLVSVGDGIAPEEAPSDPPSLILNGWIYALWGLWDVAAGLDDEDCRNVFERSTEFLRRSIERYDVGWWSRYSLYPHPIPDLAKPFYHRLHIDQLEALYRLVGHAELLAAARRWESYNTPIHKAAVLVQKARFVSLL